MTPELFIENYGYLALAAGAVLEGETIVIIAGFLVHRGYLQLHWVILVAFLGSTLGDQIYFWLGRLRGRDLLPRHPEWQARADRVYRLLERHHVPFLLGFRFMTGMRTVGAIVIGMSNIQPSRFAVFNAAGAALWSVVMVTGGYLFGNVLETLLKNIKYYESLILGIIAVIGLSIWLTRLWRDRTAKRQLLKGGANEI